MHRLAVLAVSVVVFTAPRNATQGTAAPGTAASRTAQEPVELRWRGVPGDVLRYRMTMIQTMELSMMPQPTTTETAFVVRQKVLDVSPEGVGSLEVEYEALRMQTDGPVSLSYDSTRTGEQKAENDPNVAAMLEPFLGAKIRMKIDASNHILEITGLTEAVDAALDGLENPAMGDALRGMFSEDNLRRMFEVNTFPEEALEPGDGWEREMEFGVPLVGTLQLELQNELQGFERRREHDCAAIQVTGEARLEAGAVDSRIPMTVSMDDSTISGTMFFALDKGYLIEMSLQMDMDMTMGPKDETAGQGMELQFSATTEQRMLLIGDDDPYFE